jgi:hypothetical protein
VDAGDPLWPCEEALAEAFGAARSRCSAAQNRLEIRILMGAVAPRINKKLRTGRF